MDGVYKIKGMIRGFGLLLCVAMLGFHPSAATAAQYTLKFATLAPAGSTWMNLLEEWGERVKAGSNGRLELKFYAGAVQGDEPDVLKKMRFDQLQGGAFTGYGIGKMNSQARVMELPYMFDNHAEIDYVRNALAADLEQGFQANGYRLLGWIEIGYIYFFSTQPINNLDDLKQRRIWLWQGDELGAAMFRARGLSPIPLSLPDVTSSLMTGLIDTVYCTPLAAIAVQWFTRTHYVTQVPMLNGIGALVVSNRFFEKLPADLQTLLLQTGHEAGERMIAAARIDNEKSIDVLKQEGLSFVMEPSTANRKELAQLRDATAAEMNKSGYISQAIYQRTRDLQEAFRKSHPELYTVTTPAQAAARDVPASGK